MPNQPRALIIAIENYTNQPAGLAPSLPGTNESGRDFYDWLTATKKVKNENIWYCGEGPAPADLPPANFSGTSYASIRRALINLIKQGKDKTSELYFFFSGHGLAWQQDTRERPVDVLVASDFSHSQTDGNLCARLSEIERKFDANLGGADHYFFIDACRNVLPGKMIDVSSLTLALDTAELGDRTLYRIYSTASGEVAAINSGFAKFLKQGLHGEGKAKVLHNRRFWVRFDRLFRYIQQGVGPRQPMEFKSEGRGEGLIYQLPDPVTTDCKVMVDDGRSGAQYALKVTSDDLVVTSVPTTFPGPAVTLQLRPREEGYSFEVTSGSSNLEQVSPPQNVTVDLYDPVEIHFRRKMRGARRVSTGLDAPSIQVSTFTDPQWARDTEVIVTNLSTRQPRTGKNGKFDEALTPGDWAVEARLNGNSIARRRIHLTAGERRNLDLVPPPQNRALRSITRALPAQDNGRIVWVSETLDPQTQQDPALLLALLGAGRILQPAGHFSKIGSLNLASFADVPAGEGVVYALFGREISIDVQLEILGNRSVKFEPVVGMEDVMQAKLLAPAVGTQLIQLTRGELSRRTWASVVLANRATFFVFTEDERGNLQTQQFLLPLYHLRSLLRGPTAAIVTREISEPFGRGSLRMTRLLSMAQQHFLARQEMSAPVTDEDRHIWDDMLHGKWIEPLVAIMTGFEMLRRDRDNPILQEVSLNLRTYFSEIPDVEVFAALLDRRRPEPNGIPLLRDALLQVPDHPDRPPYNEQKLDFDSPLTCWMD